MRRMKPSKVGILRSKVLRILGLNRDSEFSCCPEETNADSPIHYKYFAYPREIGLAMLEAEQKKAKGLMEWEKHRLVFR